MFVCMYTDPDGLEFFGYGETMERSFDNLCQVYEDTGPVPGQASPEPDDSNIEFFEKIAVQYVTRPRFERV